MSAVFRHLNQTLLIHQSRKSIETNFVDNPHRSDRLFSERDVAHWICILVYDENRWIANHIGSFFVHLLNNRHRNNMRDHMHFSSNHTHNVRNLNMCEDKNRKRRRISHLLVWIGLFSDSILGMNDASNKR